MSLFPLTTAHYYKLHGEPESPALKENALVWLTRANLMLADAFAVGVAIAVDQVSLNYIASGHRPAGVNAATSNAVTGSKHLIDKAGDVQDSLDGRRQLAVFCVQRIDLLEKHELWMEDPRWTGGRTNTDPWCHWQTVPPGSGRRIYIPYADVVANPATDPDFYQRHGLAAP